MAQTCVLPKDRLSDSNGSHYSVRHTDFATQDNSRDIQQRLIKTSSSQVNLGFALQKSHVLIKPKRLAAKRYSVSDVISYRIYPRYHVTNIPQTKPVSYNRDLLWTSVCVNRDSAREKLESLSSRVVDIMSELSEHNHRAVLKGLAALNSSIRDTALSGNLPEDVANALGPLSSAIDDCTYLVYESLRSGDTDNVVEQQKIVPFLEGVQKALARFSTMK